MWAFLLSLIVALTISPSAFSQEQSPVQAIFDNGKLLQDAMRGQAIHCQKPRTNTSAKCNEDFQQFYPLAVEYLAWHILYLRAVEKGDVKNVDYYKRMYLEYKDRTVAVAQVLDEQYMPLPTSKK